MKPDNIKKTMYMRLAPLSVATIIALGLSLPAEAVVIADTTSGSAPGVHTTTGGTTVVDINKPSDQGVSHNVYTKFDVDSNGVILNNSGTDSNTQLAGQISGNSNITDKSASIILNEVRSSDPSQLNGMIEVAGASAQVIVANPAGITCDGCGFVNASRSVLTTGTPDFDKDGNLQGLVVKQGQVTIKGKGMDVGNNGKAAYSDIIARSVKINGEVQANNLKITTGANKIDKAGQATVIEGTGPAPELALDVSSLGSMYANKITMIGTEKGVGVHLDNADVAAAEDLYLSVDGNIETSGKLTAGHTLTLTSGSTVTNTGTIEVTKGSASISGKQVINQNGIITGGDTGSVGVNAEELVDNQNGQISGFHASVSGDTVKNSQGYIHGQNALTVSANHLDNRAGEIHSNASVKIMPATEDGGVEILNNGGVIHSDDLMSIQTGTLNNDAGLIEAAGMTNIDVNSLINTNSAGFAASDSWDHAGGVYTGGIDGSHGSSIRANDIDNRNGVIASDKAGMALDIHGNLRDGSVNNENGVIRSAGSLNVANYQMVNNDRGSIAGKQDVYVDAQTYQSDNGVVSAGNDLTVKAEDGLTNTGSMTAGDVLTLNVSNGKLVNTSVIDGKSVFVTAHDMTNTGSVTAKETMNLGVMNLDNRSGELNSGGYLSIASSKNEQGEVLNTGGVIHSDGGMSIQSGTLNNDAGLIDAEGIASVDVARLINTNSASFVVSDNWKNTYDRAGGVYTGGSENPWENSNGSRIHADSLDNTNGVIASTKDGVGLSILSYTNDGALTNLNGVIQSAGSLDVDNYQLLNNDNGTIAATQDMSVSVQDYESGNGVLTAGNNLTLNAVDTLNNAGRVIAGSALRINSNGHVINNGELDGKVVSVTGNDVVNNSTIAADEGLSVTANTLDNNGELYSNGDLTIASLPQYNNRAPYGNTGSVSNNGGVIHAGGVLNISTGTLNNDAGLIESAKVATIDVTDLVNTNSANFVAKDGLTHTWDHAGGIYTGGSDNAWQGNNSSTIRANNIDNRNGVIASVKDGVALNISGTRGDGSLTNDNGVITSAGSLDLNGYQLLNNDNGKIDGAQDVSVTVQNYHSDKGAIRAANNLSLNASDTLNNEGTVKAAGALLVTAYNGQVVNRGEMSGDTVNVNGLSITNSGTIDATNEISLSSQQLLNTMSGVINGSQVAVNSMNVVNEGSITPSMIDPNNQPQPEPQPYYPDNNNGYPDNNGYNPIVYPTYNTDDAPVLNPNRYDDSMADKGYNTDNAPVLNPNRYDNQMANPGYNGYSSPVANPGYNSFSYPVISVSYYNNNVRYRS